MKKILLLLLVLFGLCGVLTAQTPYKVLEVHKKGEVTHTLNLSDIDSLTVRTVGETPDIAPNHEYVDLGLPSGTLWATTNVGAASPEDYGDYFAWGETAPKATYDLSSYKWYDDSSITLTKYNVTDNKTVLEEADDAATANKGSDWRMPTMADMQELSQQCTWTLTTINEVDGWLVVGPNSNSIFLPAAGYRSDTSLYNSGSEGHYWTSSLGSSGSCDLFFSSGGHGLGDRGNRYCGYSVRPVRASARN